MNIATVDSTFDQLGETRTYNWQWQNQNIAVVYDVQGISQSMTKRSVLLLPAFSTVCSRTEMADIARALAAKSGADVALCSRTVLNDYLLPERLREPRRERACKHVGSTTRRKRHDKTDRFAWIALCDRD